MISSEENSDPRTFENVKVFAGDNFFDPADAIYKNLEYERRPEGKLFFCGYYQLFRIFFLPYLKMDFIASELRSWIPGTLPLHKGI